MPDSIQFRSNLALRRLALIILLIGIVLAGVLFYPISQVFAGEWKLQQQIELFTTGALEIGSPDWLVNLGGVNYQLFLQIPPNIINLRYYAIFILAGLLAGYALAIYLAKRHFVVGSVVDRMMIGLIVFGFVGARLLFVAFNWDQFSDEPASILLELSQGGLAIFGAIMGGLGYIYFYTRRFKFNFFEFMDFICPSLLLGQIIGRWGNFFNYEAYGPSTSVLWKMYVPETANFYEDINQRFFHPTFLYEIIPAWLLLVYLLFNYSEWTKKHSGKIFAGYCIGYGLIRAITEFWRLDALKVPLPFSLQLGIFSFNTILVSQALALILVIVGIYTFSKRAKVIYLKRRMDEFFL